MGVLVLELDVGLAVFECKWDAYGCTREEFSRPDKSKKRDNV
jgi:hypothetical protein